MIKKVAEKSQWLDRLRKQKKEKSYNTTAKSRTTTTYPNSDTREERRKWMQKRARPDIRHAILTARLNEWPTRQMQK